MSTGKAKQVLEAVMKAVERDGECVFKLNEVDALIQKESVVDGKEAKLDEIIMKINENNKKFKNKRLTVSQLDVLMKKMKEVCDDMDAFNDEYGKKDEEEDVLKVVKKELFESQIEACSKVWDDGTIEIDTFELLEMVKKDDQDKREKDLMIQLGLVSDGKKVIKDCVYIKLVGESYYKTVIELGTYDESKLFDLYELIAPLKTKEFPHDVTFGGLKSVQHGVWGARPNDLASLIYGGDLCGDIIVLDGDDEEEDAGSLAKIEVIAEGLKKYLEMKRNGN